MGTNLITQDERIASVVVRKFDKYSLRFLLTEDTVRICNDKTGIALKKDIFEIEDLETDPEYPKRVFSWF